MDEGKIWSRTDSGTGKRYIISARRDWIDEKFVQKSLASEEIYWAVPMSDEAITTMLDNSLTLCLYYYKHNAASPSSSTTEPDKSSVEQIGMARAITDRVTFAYLTDVFITPEQQGNGLGNWLVECLKGAFDDIQRAHGAFRRLTLLTARGGRTVDFYKRTLGMEAGEDIPDLVFLTTKYRIHS